ncbi:MAG: CHAT domain-containing protein [Leptolyngbya sp. SIO1E4]|nr:CHAT domain-containing protein [Leptolyngbya sp. SIO1E4]
MTPALKRSLRFLLIGLLTLAICILGHSAIAQSPNLSPTEHLQQGQQAYSNGQYTQAADFWQTAAEGYATAQDSLHQAMALSNLGLAYLRLGLYDKGETEIATALDLIQSLPETPEQQKVWAQVLSAQAQYQQGQGRYTTAIQSLSQAQAGYAAVDDAAGLVRSQLNQAQIFGLQGRHRQALTLLNQVAEQLETMPNSVLKANGLRQLGDALRRVENAEQARTMLEASLAVTQAINAPDEQGATLVSLGNTAEALQQPDRALNYYSDAAAIATDPTLQLQAQVNRLRLLQAQNELSPAQTQLAEILQTLDTLTPGRDSLFVRINLADLLVSENQLMGDRAVADLLAMTLQQATALQDVRSQSYALGYLGKLYQKTQQWAEALDLTRQALSLSQSINANSVTYRWQWQLGQLLAAQGEETAAIEVYQQTVETLTALRSDLAAINPEVRFSFREGIEPIYRELVSLLLKSDNARAPLQTNLLQARDVIESLQVAELVNFFRADCVVTTPVEIDQVDSDALVIYPIILPDRLEVVVSAPGQPLHQATVPIPADQINPTLDALRQSISLPVAGSRSRAARASLALEATTGESDYLPLAQQVYNWLIRPIEAQIQAANADVLVFVLDGALRNVPMAVLHDGESYLIEKYAIALTPGLQLLEPQSLAERQIEALVAGLSKARDEFGALPNVEREVTAIQTQVPGAVLLNEGFSKENFAAQLTDSSFPVVHLATHGQFSSDPEQTFVLAWDDRIRATELGTLLQRGELSREAAVELLVLSACETAAGDEQAALGLAGVAVRSGARSTLATLWLVDDEGTSVLMDNFYSELADAAKTKAEVLRQAQLQLLQDDNYGHPYFWAPFVLVGNWL